jgi:histidyl-tRNA synthetase
LSSGEQRESVAVGGRYDNLVRMLYPILDNVPCVGVSIDVERVFSVLNSRLETSVRTMKLEVFVASAEKNLVEDRMRLCKELWDANIKVI